MKSSDNQTARTGEAAHTPGPWVLDYDRGSTQDILSREHGGICTVRRAGRHDNATFAANARLIAAAPDIFEALEDLLSTCEAQGIRADLLAKARAALAKAKGQPTA